MAATQVRGATHVCSCSSSFIEIVVCLYRFSGAPACRAGHRRQTRQRDGDYADPHTSEESPPMRGALNGEGGTLDAS